MNKDSLLILVLGVGAAYYLAKKPAATTTKTSNKPAPAGPQEIRIEGNANGWQYFTDGTAISPDGTYYYQGQMVWNSTM